MNDDTTQLRFIAATPAQITETSEETETAALIADLSDRLAGILRLIGSRADATARDALHEEIVRLVADAQQLDAHLAEADHITTANHDAAFAGWLNAPGGEQR